MSENNMEISLAIKIYVAMNFEKKALELPLFDELPSYEQQKYFHVARTIIHQYDIKFKEESKMIYRKRPDYCRHPFGARCIYRNSIECDTCTKWNKEIQKDNFVEEDDKK